MNSNRAKVCYRLFSTAAFLLVALSGSPGRANILPTLDSMDAGTSYGATNYVALGNPGPTYILNNFTGDVDILNSPGSGYQTANPVVGNNVASTGAVPGPYFFGWTGGVAPLSGAPFGTGLTAVTPTAVGFALSDSTVGCCTASYSITSLEDDYAVGAGGFNGSFGAYLSISGTNLTANDAAVASAIVSYSVNGGPFILMPQMVLAAGGACNNVAIGGAGGGNAAVIENGCAGNNFTALSIDNLGNFIWGPGTTVDIVATITAYADPANFDLIDSYIPDPTLIGDTDTTLPTFAPENTGDSAPTPEPATFGLGSLALLGMGVLARRRRA